MNADALLDHLAQRGLRLVRVGDMVHADVRPDVDLAPFVPLIKERKAELLAALHLREEIIAATTVDPEHFDRTEYDRLWSVWHAQENAQ